MDDKVPMDFVRVVMVLASTIVLLGGASLVVMGILFTSGIYSFQKNFTDQLIFSNAAYLILAVGVLLIVIGLLGCCGTLIMSKCVLGIFFFLMTTIFVLNLAACILSFAFADTLKKAAFDSLTYYNDNDTVKGQQIKLTWNALQSSFDCCGIEGINDWYNASIQNPPPPCSDTEFVKGCEGDLSSQYLNLGIIAVVVLFSQLVTMALSVILFFRQRDLEQKVKFDTDVYEMASAAIDKGYPLRQTFNQEPFKQQLSPFDNNMVILNPNAYVMQQSPYSQDYVGKQFEDTDSYAIQQQTAYEQDYSSGNDPPAMTRNWQPPLDL